MKVTLQPTGELYETNPIMVRAWTGTTEDGAEIVAFIAGSITPKADRAALAPSGQPSPPSFAARLGVWALFGKLSDAEASELLSFVTSRAAFRDDTCAERECDHCGNPYRGPSVYCCHACATADAA